MEYPLNKELASHFETASELYPDVQYTRQDAWSCPEHHVVMYTEKVNTPIGVFESVTCTGSGCAHSAEKRVA